MEAEAVLLARAGASTTAPPYGAAQPPAGRAKDDETVAWRLVATSVGTLADAYDLFTIDLVVLILTLLSGESVLGPRQKSIMVSFMLLGTISGQLLFGFAADRLGRKWCFVATAGLTVVGALLSASVQASHLPLQLALSRFVLGFGVGGEYPLSAAVTAEMDSDSNRRGLLMIMVLSMQGFGMLLSSLLAMLCMWMDVPLETTWRFLLGFGAAPSLAAFCMRWRMHESKMFSAVQRDRQAPPAEDAGRLKPFGPKLIGTAGCWMMMNLSLYSMGSFKSTILNEGSSPVGLDGREQLIQAASLAAITSIFALIGFALAFLVINRTGRYFMQLWGFVALASIFCVLSFLDFSSSPSIYVGLLGTMFLFQNCGPNSTCYIVPAEAFPTRMRASCHGVSAASGKLGALLGTSLLPFVEDAYGLHAVYLACAGASLIGASLTWWFTPRAVMDAAELDATG